MRKTLNENPIAQVVLIGVLVIVVGFLFMTRIAGQGSDAESAAPAAAETSSAPTSSPTPSEPATSSAVEPTAPSSAASGTGDTLPPVAGASDFEAGPGLPKAVASAYEDGDTVVMLVVRKGGIDDAKLARSIGTAGETGSTALFVVETKRIADYSRVTEGVDLDRAPALVVVEPKRLAAGSLPEASVSYGFRGPQSIRQAVRDANYSGRENVPYYPE